MSEHLFLEEGDYFAFCQAFENADGKWEASVAFELKAENTKTIVPGMRHKVGNGYANRDDAISAAAKYAHAHASTQDTGLE